MALHEWMFANAGHFLWCGERTRQLDAAHVEFMRGIGNPIGVKVSDKMDPNDLVTMIHSFNPENTPGRLAVIVRMGQEKLRAKLPALVQAVERAGQTVTWICDPMHGNTESCGTYKTRRSVAHCGLRLVCVSVSVCLCVCVTWSVRVCSQHDMAGCCPAVAKSGCICCVVLDELASYAFCYVVIYAANKACDCSSCKCLE